MSTIRVDNFGPSAGGTTYSARGIAKAWVNFNGAGTIAARDSENVSSLTDNGTGDYTLNISNAFGAADYAATGSSEWTPGVTALSVVTVRTYATSSLRLDTSNSANGAKADPVFVNAALFGDLA